MAYRQSRPANVKLPSENQRVETHITSSRLALAMLWQNRPSNQGLPINRTICAMTMMTGPNGLSMILNPAFPCMVDGF